MTLVLLMDGSIGSLDVTVVWCVDGLVELVIDETGFQCRVRWSWIPRSCWALDSLGVERWWIRGWDVTSRSGPAMTVICGSEVLWRAIVENNWWVYAVMGVCVLINDDRCNIGEGVANLLVRCFTNWRGERWKICSALQIRNLLGFTINRYLINLNSVLSPEIQFDDCFTWFYNF